MQIVSTLVDITIRLAIWRLVLGDAEADNVSYLDMIAYTMVGTVVQALTWSSPAPLIARKVADGSIAYDMVKPVNLNVYFLCVTIGNTISDFALRVVPSVALATLFFGVGSLQPTPTDIILFVLLSAVGFFSFVAWEIILALLGFWLADSWWVGTLSRALMRLFGGTFVPLWFFPAFLGQIAAYTPFRFMYFVPTAAAMGKLEAPLATLCLGLAWAVGLWLILGWIWVQLRKRILIFGG